MGASHMTMAPACYGIIDETRTSPERRYLNQCSAGLYASKSACTRLVGLPPGKQSHRKCLLRQLLRSLSRAGKLFRKSLMYGNIVELAKRILQRLERVLEALSRLFLPGLCEHAGEEICSISQLLYSNPQLVSLLSGQPF